ncbi:hypothetical protein BC829DRAFT_400780 [Chytridium lagenaria]|nr:hypothetical protein BC829DRAFT_400780 [Chytridium lagenaria]
MSLWQASTTIKPTKVVHDDDDWETDPGFVNNISEKDQRSQLRDAVLKIHGTGEASHVSVKDRKKEYQTPGVDQVKQRRQ